jgi:hypothetical protein
MLKQNAGREKVSGLGGGFRPDFQAASMKPKLLAVELCGIGDLVLATPFPKASTGQFEAALLARPSARELPPRLWPGVEVVAFRFPWLAFARKYEWQRWSCGKMASLAGGSAWNGFSGWAANRAGCGNVT